MKKPLMNCIIREIVCMGWEHIIISPANIQAHTVQNYTIQTVTGTDNSQMLYWSLLNRTLEGGKIQMRCILWHFVHFEYLQLNYMCYRHKQKYSTWPAMMF